MSITKNIFFAGAILGITPLWACDAGVAVDGPGSSEPVGVVPTATGTNTPETNCNGCRTFLYDSGFKPPHACAGAEELAQQYRSCMCGVCEAVCGFCEPYQDTPNMAACQDCWAGPASETCKVVSVQCADDRRVFVDTAAAAGGAAGD